MLKQKFKLNKQKKATNKKKSLYIKKTFTPKDFHTLNINLSHSNCIITLRNDFGKTLKTLSIGQVGYKNARKSSNVAHSTLINEMCKFAINQEIKLLNIQFNGLKRFKRTIIQEIIKFNFLIHKISDTTPLTHNGCRKMKRKRR